MIMKLKINKAVLWAVLVFLLAALAYFNYLYTRI